MSKTSILDGLTPTEYLVFEVLAARWRLGEDCWTFPSEVGPALVRLEDRGFIGWKPASIASACLVWLTDEGAKEYGLQYPYRLSDRVWGVPE